MHLRVRLFGIARAAAGRRELSITVDRPTTVRDTLKLLEREQPGLAGMLLREDAIAPGIDILKNGRNIRYDPLEATLSDGDVLSICPPITGGCL